MPGNSEYHVYLLRCEGGELYAGITTDLERRFAEHASGGPKGARYTRTHPPVRYEATWDVPDRATASALEYRLKRLTHVQKEAVAADPMMARELLTHEDGVPYLEYVRAIKGNAIAHAVKVADLKRNSDLTRLDEVTPADRERVEKYARALEILEGR